MTSSIQSPQMWLDDRYRGALAAAGLAQFEDVMQGEKGRCLRVLPDRENWYLRVGEEGLPADATGLGMYLKKHRISTWSTRVRAALGTAPVTSAGRLEAENARALDALGIAVMPVVAYGERLSDDGRLESFLLTEELAGYGELQDFIVRKFRPAGERSAAESGELRRLVRQVAGVARRLHTGGYNHRDFYSCHLLIREESASAQATEEGRNARNRPSPPAPLHDHRCATVPGEGRYDIRLIDLQRVERRRWFRRRWIVKDLAQLASMLPDDRITCREKVLFLRHYLGVRRVRGADRRLVRAVLRKQEIIRRRQGRH